jgi:uncharacterized membrane protein
MSRLNRAFDVISLAAIGGTVAFTASVYDALPGTIAVHFGLHGEPNGWMGRGFATWGVDAFALAIWALIRFSPAWLPEANGWKSRAAKSPMAAVGMLTSLLLAGVSLFIVWNALHPEMPRMTTAAVMIGIYAFALSAVLPRTRRNPVLGIRTPFSLTSDENWARANRVGSYAFAAGGLACLVGALVGAPMVGILLFAAAAIVPSIYSWKLAYRLPPEA